MSGLMIQLGLIVVSIATVFTVIMPMYGTIGTVQAEMEGYDEALKSAREVNLRLKALNDQINDVSQQSRHRINMLVPEYAEGVKVAYDIDQLLLSSDMFVDSIVVNPEESIEMDGAIDTGETFSGMEESSSMVAQDIQLSISGTYENLKDLLAQFEQSSRLMDVVSIGFESIDGDLAAYELTIRVYGQKSDPNFVNKRSTRR